MLKEVTILVHSTKDRHADTRHNNNQWKGETPELW